MNSKARAAAVPKPAAAKQRAVAPTKARPAIKPAAVAAAADFYDPASYRPEEGIGFPMRRVLNAMAAEIDRRLEPAGLTNAQWVPLLKLHLGTASTVAELARVCVLDGGAMTRTLDRLETKGLLQRVRSSADRRVVNLELTDAGRRAAEQIPAVLCQVQNLYLRGFSAGEWELLRTLLKRLHDNAQAVQQEGAA